MSVRAPSGTQERVSCKQPSRRCSGSGAAARGFEVRSGAPQHDQTIDHRHPPKSTRTAGAMAASATHRADDRTGAAPRRSRVLAEARRRAIPGASRAERAADDARSAGRVRHRTYESAHRRGTNPTPHTPTCGSGSSEKRFTVLRLHRRRLRARDAPPRRGAVRRGSAPASRARRRARSSLGKGQMLRRCSTRAARSTPARERRRRATTSHRNAMSMPTAWLSAAHARRAPGRRYRSRRRATRPFGRPTVRLRESSHSVARGSAVTTNCVKRSAWSRGVSGVMAQYARTVASKSASRVSALERDSLLAVGLEADPRIRAQPEVRNADHDRVHRARTRRTGSARSAPSRCESAPRQEGQTNGGSAATAHRSAVRLGCGAACSDSAVRGPRREIRARTTLRRTGRVAARRRRSRGRRPTRPRQRP